MVGGSRRIHTKSRNGCGQCKKRHIKCDGRWPRCYNCGRWNIQCGYQSLISVPRSMPVDRFQLQFCQLIQHWTNTTYATVGLVSGPEIERIWRVVIPGQSQTCPFLMHSILAFTGIHMAHLNPCRRVTYSNLARQHQIQASELFRSSVSGNCVKPSSISTFSFLILTTLTSLGLIQEEAEGLDSFIDFLDLMRHALRFAVSYETPAEDDGGVVAIMVASKWHPSGLLNLDEQLQSSLERLEYINSVSSTASISQKAILSHAIEQTKQWYSYVPVHPSNLVFIPHWLIMITDEFFGYLREKNQVALALLAHWIVPSHNAPWKWYMGDWPRKVVRSIAKELGAAKIELIEWVLAEVRISAIE